MNTKTTQRFEHTKALIYCLRFIKTIFCFTPVLLMCSCATPTEKQYNLGFEGAARPSEEAILRIKKEGNIEPFIHSIDGESHDKYGKRFYLSYAPHSTRPINVRLLPGTHKVKVNCSYSPDGLESWDVVGYQNITFEAVAGKTYDLKFHVGDFNHSFFRVWARVEVIAGVVEVETGKEFLPDRNLNQ